MGWNTTINIKNDCLDVIEGNPEEFVSGIVHAMHHGGEFGIANHANPVQVAKTGHADDFRLYGVHQNLMIELTPYSLKTNELVERLPDLIRAHINNARYLLDRLESTLPAEGDTKEW